MIIEKTVDIDGGQMSRIGRHRWSVARLIFLSRNFEVMEISLNHLNVADSYDHLRLRDMVSHMRAVLSADLSKPIILDEDGEIMDGRHRVMKALLNNEPTIRAVRFDVNPSPCRYCNPGGDE